MNWKAFFISFFGVIALTFVGAAIFSYYMDLCLLVYDLYGRNWSAVVFFGPPTLLIAIATGLVVGRGE